MKFSADDDGIQKGMLNAVAQAVGIASERFKKAVGDLAVLTHARAVQMAGQRLHTTKQKYVDALHIDQIDEDTYSISLDDSARDLEKGYDSFNMIQAGLTKGPKSKVNKRGYRYVRVPFGHNPNAKVGNNSQVQIQNMRENRAPGEAAKGLQSKGSLRGDLKAIISVMKSAGVSTQGNFTIKADPTNTNNILVDRGGGTNTAQRVNIGQPLNPLINGTQKKEVTLKGGKTINAYTSFRTASEDPSAKPWIHPGFDGAKIFPDLAMWAEQELEKLLGDL